MTNRETSSTDILIVGGGAAGMSAALAASSNKDLRVTLVDDNPQLGGQIWRAELGKTKSADALKLITAIESGRIEIVNNAQVFAARNENSLLAQTPNGSTEFAFQKLIIATGALERFLPFPGWTLPNVLGAGGLQALVKGGLNVTNKRIVIAGTGPLLLAVAEYLKSKGANVVAIAEQASAAKIRRFAFGLWRSPSKLAQGIVLRSRLLGIPYFTDCWVTRCKSPRVSKGDTSNLRESPLLTRGLSQSLTITLNRNGKTSTIECDYLACGFHLVPNTELASLLGCRIENSFVAVDEFHRTSCENIFCAGEPTGIGGVEASLVEGKIAGFAAAGNEDGVRQDFAQRDKTGRFAERLNRAFELRDELKYLADDATLICRCEDVIYGAVKDFDSGREAKLQTRCGMGACQGRVCGVATEFMFGWEADTARPPIFPVRMENL